MYEFFDRLINVAIPRIRDFRGLSTKAFDAKGNYSIGISDYTIFPEVNLDSVEFFQGMDVTLVIKNGSPKASLELLKLFGLPFKSEELEKK
jgi:large subunit ribosomal protein L5